MSNESSKSNESAAPVDLATIVREKLSAQGSHFRPEAVADALGISGKIVRSYLRQTFPRPIEAKGTTWTLNVEEATQTIVHFKTRTNAADAKQTITL